MFYSIYTFLNLFIILLTDSLHGSGAHGLSDLVIIPATRGLFAAGIRGFGGRLEPGERR